MSGPPPPPAALAPPQLEPEPPELGARAAKDCAVSDASTNVSQTQLLQMTASSAPPPSEGKWSCDVCTYQNFPLSRKCTMCLAPKPLLGEDIFRLQQADGAAAHPHPHHDLGATALECAERLKPLRISSPPPQPCASALHKWCCPTCTYENWPKSLKCAMCGTASPAPLLAAPPLAAPPPVAPPLAAPSPPLPAAAAPPPSPLTPTDSRTSRTPVGINELFGAVSCEEARRKRRNADWIWLQACLGVVEGDVHCVEAYLSSGGDPARALTPNEVALLNRASAFDPGHTLVHLAIRFQRQDILSVLLSRISGGGPGLKRSPSYVAPDLAHAIRRQLAQAVRLKKGHAPAKYLNEVCTFWLPGSVEELPAAIQQQLFGELLDGEAQAALERASALNWSDELVERGSRLVALWNRSAGDCLPDAACQAAYGVFDRANTLRAAMGDTLAGCARALFARFAAWERAQAAHLHYDPDEPQLRHEWARLVAAARRPGTPLHQLHVFTLAHVLRRPILVYGVDLVHSFRGEALGYARFQGIYLPLMWEPEFCSKSPLCLGYTRGHFSALVPIEPYTRHPYICREQQDESEDSTLLPLTDYEGKLLPVHFLTCDEMGEAESLVRRFVAVSSEGGGVLTARQALPARPLLVAQMVEEWLNHYRRLAQQMRGPFPPRLAAGNEYCSDPDTDDE